MFWSLRISPPKADLEFSDSRKCLKVNSLWRIWFFFLILWDFACGDTLVENASWRCFFRFMCRQRPRFLCAMSSEAGGRSQLMNSGCLFWGWHWEWSFHVPTLAIYGSQVVGEEYQKVFTDIHSIIEMWTFPVIASCPLYLAQAPLWSSSSWRRQSQSIFKLGMTSR